MNLLQTWIANLIDKASANTGPKFWEKEYLWYHRNFKYMPGKHVQEFRNTSARPLEIDIEPYPDRYVLQPGDEMTVIYEQDPDRPGAGLTTWVYESGLQIFLQEFDTAIILINGRIVEPWTDAAKS